MLSRLPDVAEGAWEGLFGIECSETITMEPVNNRQKSVKVIDKRPHTKRKGELYNLLGCSGIFLTKMHTGQGVFFPIVREGDLEEILKKEVMETALEKGFEIKIPIKYSAMKTVIVKEIDSIIDEYENQEINNSIESINERAKVVEVYKFDTESKMVKIQFESMAMANRAAKDGIIILSQRIPARRIEKEIFVKLMPCNNCYGYDHETKNCTKEKLTCAYCGEEGHKQNNCRSETPRCLNYSGAHGR